MKKVPADPAASPRRPRGRPREFDREQALERAMQVFWEKASRRRRSAISPRRSASIRRASYAAFGDKERLFLAAMERYVAMRSDSCPYESEPTAEEATRKLLTYMAQDLSASGHPKGCLMVMSIATSTNASPALHQALARNSAQARARMKARFELAIREGELPADTDPGELVSTF
jgi:hypothetical protein